MFGMLAAPRRADHGSPRRGSRTPMTALAGVSARQTARTARRYLVDEAGDRVNAAADEARARAVLAYDALAGRRRGLPWGWLISTGVIALALGWTLGTAARIGIRKAEEAAIGADRPDFERIEFVDVDPPPGTYGRPA